MANRTLDPQTLTSTMLGVIEKILSSLSGIVASSQPETKEVEIVEYEDRMRVLSMHDFESPIYIAVVNYYLTTEEMERKKSKGTMVLYVDPENASKLYKALNFSFPDDEDDASMLEGCGQFCKMIGEGLKNELVNMGYVNLIMSAPQYYKNSIMDGVEYSKDQKTKSQLSFFYWKRKALVVELSMSDIPKK